MPLAMLPPHPSLPPSFLPHALALCSPPAYPENEGRAGISSSLSKQYGVVRTNGTTVNMGALSVGTRSRLPAAVRGD